MKRALYIGLVLVLFIILSFVTVWGVLQRINADKIELQLNLEKVLSEEDRKKCEKTVNDLNLKVDSLNNLMIDMAGE